MPLPSLGLLETLYTSAWADGTLLPPCRQPRFQPIPATIVKYLNWVIYKKIEIHFSQYWSLGSSSRCQQGLCLVRAWSLFPTPHLFYFLQRGWKNVSSRGLKKYKDKVNHLSWEHHQYLLKASAFNNGPLMIMLQHMNLGGVHSNYSSRLAWQSMRKSCRKDSRDSS